MMQTETIKNIAAQLGVPNVSEALEAQLKQLVCDQTRIAVVGGDNVGKSTFINALLGTNLEESSLPSATTHRITYKGGHESSVPSESAWLKDMNIEVWELAPVNLPVNATLVDYGRHYICADVCVMLLNSMAALSRTGINHLDFLEQMGIPTLVVLSKADQICEADYAGIMEYVKKNLSKYHNVKMLTAETPLHVTKQVDEVRTMINALLEEVNPSVTSRASLTHLFETDAVATLFEVCNEKLQKADETTKKVEAITNEKRQKLSDASTTWLRLHTHLTQRKNETSLKIKETFEKRKKETIRQLTHCVEMCGDVKLFWEKELPYRLEDVMKANSQAASQLINAEIINTLNWLNVEIKKSFNKSLNAIQPITCSIEPESIASTETPEIADNKKIRIIARVGTAATVIAAGTMFATMGIGGIVMATGMMAGIGAEFFMSRKQNESKEKVIALIPMMVEQAQQKLIVNISDTLNNSYGELINNLQKYQEEWLEEAEKNIDKEKQIALFNCKAELDKWNSCMNEINTLSESLLNN